MDQPAIEVVDLEQRYAGKTVLKIPHLSIAKGEVLVLLGPNGSGKSTLLRLMGLLEEPYRGKLSYSGRKPVTKRERLEERRRMTMVFQDPLLFTGTVASNVAYGLNVRGAGRESIDSLVEESLALLGVSHLVRRQANTLSGGEAQRVALARALAIRPEIFFLDEPTAYLDAPTKQAFLKDLQALLKRLSLTAVFVTHDRSEALAIGGRVAVLEEGLLRQVGPVEQVFRRPVSLSVAAFLGADRVGSGRVSSRGDMRVVTVDGLRINVSPGEVRSGIADIVIRPEDIRMGVEGNPEGDENVISGRVSDITPAGNVYRITLDCGLNLSGYLTAYDLRSRGINVGGELKAFFSPDSVHLLPSARSIE